MDKGKNSAFKKVDLHVHTPRSACYRDKSVALEQIVDAALESGLDVMAITDHNTVSAIAEIREIRQNRGLYVFPGLEVSTREGHVLAIFELDTPVGTLEDFLDDAGITREEQGDAITLAHGGLEEVSQKIEEWGGVAIAAHIERWPSGFLEANSPRQAKMRIHSCPYISALEITIPQNKGLWNDGQVWSYPKKYACIQGSDAHALVEVGRRPVFIRMEEVGLGALRSAFADHKARIVFPGECAPD